MSSRSDWATFVQWTLWGIAMAAVGGWLGRARMKARPMAESRVLVHPRSTLIIGVACTVIFAAFTVLALTRMNDAAPLFIFLLFGGFLLGSLLVIREYYVVRVEVSESGMTWRKLSGARKELKWVDVKTVRYSNSMKWFRVETMNGDVARISLMLMGLPQFAQLLWNNAPAQAFDALSKETIQRTADGNPPSIWG